MAEHIQTDRSVAFTVPHPGEHWFTMSLQAEQPYVLSIDRNIQAERPAARLTDSLSRRYAVPKDSFVPTCGEK